MGALDVYFHPGGPVEPLHPARHRRLLFQTTLIFGILVFCTFFVSNTVFWGIDSQTYKNEGKRIYCHVPEGRGLQQIASPPSQNETWSVNPLVRKKVDLTTEGKRTKGTV